MSKTIIITGTSSGVGFALGNYFYKKGYHVFGLSRSIPENALFKTISTDITKKEEVKNAFSQILKEVETIDFLINNAGKGMVGAVEDATQEEIISLFNLNLAATVSVISETLPLMRKNGKGKIINISSIGSIMGLPFRGFYSASKAALDMITESMRYELMNSNIEVCSVNLGDVKTNIAESRIKSNISHHYKDIFDKVYDGMNADVDKGFEPETLAPFIEKLLNKQSKLKPHYYFGAFTQKLSLVIKSILPQKWFEKIIAKYSGI